MNRMTTDTSSSTGLSLSRYFSLLSLGISGIHWTKMGFTTLQSHQIVFSKKSSWELLRKLSFVRSALTDRGLLEPIDVGQRDEWSCLGSRVNTIFAFKPWKRTRRKLCKFDDFLLWMMSTKGLIKNAHSKWNASHTNACGVVWLSLLFYSKEQVKESERETHTNDCTMRTESCRERMFFPITGMWRARKTNEAELFL